VRVAPRRFVQGPVVIDSISRVALVRSIVEATAASLPLRVAYLNASGFELAHRDPRYAQNVAGCDLVFCDGFGALLACRLLGAAVPERMTPPDFVDDVISGVFGRGRTVYLLGDEPGVADRMAERLDRRWPGVVAGAHHGFFEATDEPDVVAGIRRSGATLVLVAMGSPRQEGIIQRWRDDLPSHVLFAVGRLFRWHTGMERRGPRWMTDHGLEWLWRLMMQPRLVARRYLVGLPSLGARVIRMRLRGERFVSA
jgi:N-acetylglucosaminyldiphosphoundecaprenol N-acetyl-beta-D-mannosaminyltransferase